MLSLYSSTTTLPVTLADIKAQLRIEHDAEDDHITDLIWAANDIIEKKLGRTFVSQTWDYSEAKFCDCHVQCRCKLFLPYPPLASITHIKYYDPNDTLVTMDTDDYYTIATTEDRGFVQPIQYWPATSFYRPNAVQIRFVTGDDVLPTSYVQLLKIWVTLLFENRSGDINKQENECIDRLEDLLRYC